MGGTLYRVAVRPGSGIPVSFDSRYTLDRAAFGPDGWSLWSIALRSESMSLGQTSRFHPRKYLSIDELYEFAKSSAGTMAGSVLVVYGELQNWAYVVGVASDGLEAEAVINSDVAVNPSHDGD